MSDDVTPDSTFEWLADVYQSHGAINHPSELHGLLMGELAAGSVIEADAWLQMVCDHMGVESLDTQKRGRLEDDLLAFLTEVSEAIDHDSGSFALLLPDDDYALAERVESLAIWVRGFLEGIALGAQDKLVSVDADLQEILRDFVEISQLDARVQGSEEGERELFEVGEYVRVGVLNLYAAFNEPVAAEAAKDKPTLH